MAPLNRYVNLPLNLRINKRLLCANVSVLPVNESVVSSSSPLSTQAASSAGTAVNIPSDVVQNKGLNLVKYGLFGILTSATAATGYLSYAYTLDEVDVKTKELRESVNFSTRDDMTTIEKYQHFLYTAAMTVPAKAVELYLDMRKLIEEQVRGFTEPTSDKLLPDLHPAEQHVFTLVLDLNETIIYSDWKRERGWTTYKRPGVDEFLQHLAKFYEIVLYSDQMNMFVDPVVERLDPNHCIRYRLSRSATKYQNGQHFRDLSKLNRNPAKILYVSAHAFEGTLQPENSVPIKPFKIDDKGEAPPDTALLDLIPFLEYVARASPADIRAVLASYKREDIANEFLERSREHQRRVQEQREHGRFWRH